MSMDPQMMQQYLQMFGGAQGAGAPRQVANTGAANAITPLLQAMMLARARKQQQAQQQPVNALAGGTGSNAAPGGGDPSLAAAMAGNVS